MENTAHILVVDDDQEIRQLVGDYLRKNGFRVSLAAEGRQMREMLDVARIDLVVLDLMLPGDDGLTLCRTLRATPAFAQMPVLMLTARGEPIDRVVGLEMGADDYLQKPFEPRELLARIRNILRRTRAVPDNPAAGLVKRYRFTDWVLDTGLRQLTSPQAVVVPLSGAEYRLLQIFLDHPQRILNRDQLMDMTKGRDADPFDRSIDLQISRLRQKLGDDARAPTMIKTVRNEGYILSAPVVQES
ncbi:MAG: response regulator transcription factor [Betaproteobacteria bacterium]|uniref:Response regulator transcription factor n=1 Tax=Candidatus Proximibacter danicus TaxID=2954365 RepID=A0A9D7K464_9PROT|nr:response regulator transcription factor [Candidatus Proximibacter danicus]